MKQVLQTNYVDDILSDSMSGKRRFNLIPNSDGTYSLEDVTTYDQIGSDFGSAIVNAICNAVNESADKNKILETLDEVVATTEKGYIPDALALKEVNNSLSKQDVTYSVNTDYVGNYAFYCINFNGMCFGNGSFTLKPITANTWVEIATGFPLCVGMTIGAVIKTDGTYLGMWQINADGPLYLYLKTAVTDITEVSLSGFHYLIQP